MGSSSSDDDQLQRKSRTVVVTKPGTVKLAKNRLIRASKQSTTLARLHRKRIKKERKRMTKKQKVSTGGIQIIRLPSKQKEEKELARQKSEEIIKSPRKYTSHTITTRWRGIYDPDGRKLRDIDL